MEPAEEHAQTGPCDTVQREAQQSRCEENVPHLDNVLGPKFLHGLCSQRLLGEFVSNEFQERQRHLEGQTECRE